LALDTLSARGATGATLAVGLLVTLLNGIRHDGDGSLGRHNGDIARRYVGTDVLAQLTTFAALADFLLSFLLRLGAHKAGLNGVYRFNDHLGTGLARCTGLTSRTRGARFTFLARFAGLTFHTLLAAHFSASFTFLTWLPLLTRFALFARTTVAAFATLATGG